MPECTAKEKELGEARMQQVISSYLSNWQLTNFILAHGNCKGVCTTTRCDDTQELLTAQTCVLQSPALWYRSSFATPDEYVVFIAPTQLQRDIFHRILTADRLDKLVRNSTAESLALIGMLTKISNSPILLKAHADKEKAKARMNGEGDTIKGSVVSSAAELVPAGARVEDVSLSGPLST